MTGPRTENSTQRRRDAETQREANRFNSAPLRLCVELIVIGFLALCCIASVGAHPSRRPLRFSDIPAGFRPWLTEQGLTESSFDTWITKINRQTAEREERGEYEHLINYALQSSRFSRLPKIEPAVSAREFAKGLSETERQLWLGETKVYRPPCSTLPETAQQRLREFIKTLRQSTDDERLRYFQQLSESRRKSDQQLFAGFCQAYAETMRFLYLKEFSGPASTQVAALYQTRGHSTDTQIEANFAVHHALAMIRTDKRKASLNRVLIVGPGLDFAPRTDLLDLFGPQSYQPFAVADALLSLGLADENRLRIHCVDINERVIAHLQHVSQSKVHQLSLLSGIAETPTLQLTEEYRLFFRNFGGALGKSSTLSVPAESSGRLSKAVTVRPELLSHFSADRFNLITETYDSAEPYDLIVATNVFPYFSDVELLLALANVAKMLAEGGYFVHNEPRVVAPAVTQPLSIPLLQSRTFLIAASGEKQGSTGLYDFAGIHQKRNIQKNK